jgi:RHS repeat-associated protein
MKSITSRAVLATAFDQDTDRMKFAGHERDLASPAGAGDDLDSMHARHCSPITGRFLSVDPAGASFDPRAPQSWNRYTYGRSNGLKYVDSNGLETQLVVGGPAAGNIFGHVALAVDGVVYSYGTHFVGHNLPDWGVPLALYLSAQSGLRETQIITLNVSPEEESRLKTYLESNEPDPDQYSEFSNSCVTVCEAALEEVGIVGNEPGPEVTTSAGDVLQAGAPGAITPSGLANQVRSQHLVTSEQVAGTPTPTWRSFLGTIKTAFRRYFR